MAPQILLQKVLFDAEIAAAENKARGKRQSMPLDLVQPFREPDHVASAAANARDAYRNRRSLEELIQTARSVHRNSPRDQFHATVVRATNARQADAVHFPERPIPAKNVELRSAAAAAGFTLHNQHSADDLEQVDAVSRLFSR